MTHEEAIERVRKLLSLATSDNPHESAQAAARAQEIMSRYAIDQASLDEGDASLVAEQDEEVIRDFTHTDPLDRNDGKRQHPAWKWPIASALDDTNQTKSYRCGAVRGIVGRPSNVATVRYLYTWLTREVERLTASNCKGYGRSYTNNFRMGCAEAIADKIREAHRDTIAAMRKHAEAQATSTALVRVNLGVATLEKRARDVEDWTEAHLKLRTRSVAPTNYNAQAREAGRKAGASINIGAKASLGTGQRQLTR